mgnify:CR=1 FL=1|jgi:hypothetical protein
MASKIIKNIQISAANINANGESRSFTVSGTKDAVFSMEVVNVTHNTYYDFSSKKFSSTRSRLNNIILKSGSYTSSISFAALPDTNTDEYTIYLFADGHYDTKHVAYKEVRRADGTLDINSSSGSDSLVLTKKLYQFANLTLTLDALSPNSVAAFASMTKETFAMTLTRGTSAIKRKFKITVTAAASRTFTIKKQPTSDDFLVFVNRTIGNAAIPIKGEDVSSSTYHKWPIDNAVGVVKGMFPLGTNITGNSIVADYISSFTTTGKEETSYTKSYGEKYISKALLSKTLPKEEISTTTIEVFEPAVQLTGTPTYTGGVLTSQSGNIVFSRQQADALKEDSIKMYGYGTSLIKASTNYNITFSNLKAELTTVTTTTTGSTIGAASTSVAIAERAGIKNGSTVTGIGIDTSSAIPTVASGAGAVSGAGTIVLSAAQELESGITLTFGGASRTVTITGDIEVSEVGLENVNVRLDVEKIITAI